MEWDLVKEILIDKYRSGYDDNRLYYIFLGLIDDLKILDYDSEQLDYYQFKQIYYGLKSGINVDIYADYHISAKKMEIIRISLENDTFSSDMLNSSLSLRELVDISKNNKIVSGKKKYQIFKKQNETTLSIIDDEYLDSISINELFEDDNTLKFEDFFTEFPSKEFKQPDEFYEYYKNFPLSEDFNLLNSVIQQYSILNAEEEIKIANEFHNSNYDSWERFLLSNIRLVWSIAKKYTATHLEFYDNFQNGFLGLIHAAHCFEPSFGTKFSTYATNWINQSITRNIADSNFIIRIPVHMQEQLKKFNKLSRDDGYQSFKIASLNYQKLGESISANDYNNYIYLDSLNDIEEITPSLIDTQFSYSSNIDLNLLREEIQTIIHECLTKRESEIISLRFGLLDGVSLTLEEIGRQYNITRERIRQIESKAIKKLQSKNIKKRLVYFMYPTLN
ncbi:sigma-70 family RNA polymerase sigma factor [Solobacterium sp.]|uniref:sigma-70 family RNA polymerase sigma factor n=1 Tax=Solobacterium sp. TaxID=2060878 RepID=UPI001CB5FA5F|nr:sigma-70 family RNA polymerase sigma factor [Solobacterium sp.]MBF1085164.1 sigma-70 family RNA polymerase sigma factor [Solobacterium sp.]